jgi:hypothetical protein
MRKGFDQSLAKALETDRATLFVNYREVAPDAAPRINPCAIVGDESSIRRKVLAIVELLDPPRLSKLHDVGRELLMAPAA